MSAPWIDVESEHSLPLVHFQLVFPGGALTDALGQGGQARLSARLLRRGTKQRAAAVIEDAIDSLGAELGIETGLGYVRLSGSVIRQSADRMMALVGELVREPRLGADEFAQLQRETLAALTETLDNDAALAGARFRRMLFGAHPFGRNVSGTRGSVKGCTVEAARDYHRNWIAPGPAILGFAGDVTQAQAETWAREHFGAQCEATWPSLAEPEPIQGRALCVVDKPARTQTQLYIGRHGSLPREADHHALIVGNAIFGGTFTSRLVRAVRSERGWSYGASSRLGADRVRDTWSMWTHPAASDAAECAALQVELMQEWVDQGVTDEEVEFVKSYLVKSHAFNVDTADKRLEQRMEQRLLELPEDYFVTYTERISQVEAPVVNAALRERLDPSQLSISMLATAADVGDDLRRLLPSFDYTVWPHDRDE